MEYASVQFSHSACPTLCDPIDCSTPGLPVHHQLPEFTQTHVHLVGEAFNQIILCHPLLLLPSIFPSIRVFSNESALCISILIMIFKNPKLLILKFMPHWTLVCSASSNCVFCLLVCLVVICCKADMKC